MKKFLLSFVVVVGFIGYALFQRGSSAASTNPSGISTDTIPTATSQSSEANPPDQTLPQTVPPTVSALYKDGTYTGPATDAYYGTIQVNAVIQNGKLTDVQVPQYPNDREESQQVSNASIPQLKSEAIQSQSANVNIVSGATQTSQAFIKSLAVALAQAKN